LYLPDGTQENRKKKSGNASGISVISVLGVDDVVEPVTGKKITHLDFVMLTLNAVMITVKKNCMCWLLALAWQYIIVG
jgi:hypothetical protein